MSMIEQVWEKARRNMKRIVLPEGGEERTVQAAARVRAEGLAQPILLGDAERGLAIPPKNSFNKIFQQIFGGEQE